MARFKSFIRSFSSFEHLRDLYGLYIDWTAVLDLQLFYLAPSFPQIILRFRSGEHQTTFPYQALYYTILYSGKSHKPAEPASRQPSAFSDIEDHGLPYIITYWTANRAILQSTLIITAYFHCHLFKQGVERLTTLPANQRSARHSPNP